MTSLLWFDYIELLTIGFLRTHRGFGIITRSLLQLVAALFAVRVTVLQLFTTTMLATTIGSRLLRHLWRPRLVDLQAKVCTLLWTPHTSHVPIARAIHATCINPLCEHTHSVDWSLSPPDTHALPHPSTLKAQGIRVLQSRQSRAICSRDHGYFALSKRPRTLLWTNPPLDLCSSMELLHDVKLHGYWAFQSCILRSQCCLFLMLFKLLPVNDELISSYKIKTKTSQSVRMNAASPSNISSMVSETGFGILTPIWLFHQKDETCILSLE